METGHEPDAPDLAETLSPVTSVRHPPGRHGAVPLAGDWDGDGSDTVGVYREPPPGYDAAPGD